MSEASEARLERELRRRAMALAQNPGNLTAADIKTMVDAGVPVPAGATIPFTSMRDLLDLGLGGGGSPTESMGLEQYLASQGMTPQQFQAQYGGLPFNFNADGTVTYDPAAQRQAFEFTPASYARNQAIGLGLLGALAGAGLTGLGNAATAPITSEIPLGTYSNAFQAVPSAVSDFSLMVPGTGLPTVGSTIPGSAGIGLSPAGIGLSPGLTSAATGMTAPSALGLNLGTTGGLIGQTASQLAGSAGVGALNSIAPQVAAPGAGNAVTPMARGASPTAASTVSRLLQEQLGINVEPGTVDLIGRGLGAGLGLLGSRASTNAMQSVQDQITGQRAPFLNQALGYLQNPESFYSSPAATGAANATMRALSTRFGNPGTSPTAQNLATDALYGNYLNTVNTLGSLGLGGQGIQANLGQQTANMAGQPYAIAGNVLGGLTSNMPNIDEILANAISRRYGGTGSLP